MSNFFLFSYGFFVVFITALTLRLSRKITKLENALFGVLAVTKLQLEINTILSRVAKEGYDNNFEQELERMLDEGK